LDPRTHPGPAGEPQADPAGRDAVLEELERERRRLQLSYALSEALAEARTEREVIATVFEKGLAVFGADAGMVALPSEDAPGTLEIAAQYGYPEELVAAWRRLPLTLRSPLTDAFREGEAVWVDSPDEARARFPEWGPAVAGTPDLAWAGLPLAAGGARLGAIGLAFRSPRATGTADRAFVASVAYRCAMALDRARTARRQREVAERLALAQDASGIGVYDWELETNRVVWSGQLEALLGLGHLAPDVRSTAWAERIHPDDRGRMEQELAAWLTEPEQDHEWEYRFVRPDGAVRWMAGRSRAIRDAEGRVVRVVGTNADVTERKRVEAELREADRRKTDFIAVLSHELRNPLAAVRNALGVLRLAPADGERVARARAALDRQVDQLARLVDDLLDVSRVSRGELELRRRRLDLREPVRRACEDARPAHESRGVALAVEAGEVAAWVEADAARVAQMAGNLLHNALKFTAAGGRVSVRIALHDGRWEVRVKDSGTGISPDALGRIFEPFVQGEEGRTARAGGMGVGLALVRELAERHGGSAWAESAGRGHGAEVAFALPAAPPPEHATPAPGPQAAAPPLEILVVEDNVDAGETLVDLLAVRGHRATLVETGRDGVDAALARRPDVLICDVGLPDLDGLEVMRLVRARHPGPGPFAIALTGYTQPEDVARTRAAGFDAHLPKPPSWAALEELLRRAAAAR
jgi:PAS domain S-box-containing protein